MQFTLTIKLGNDAMQTDGDLAEALHKVANHIDNYGDGAHTPAGTGDGIVFDLNGNRVGAWQIAKPDTLTPEQVANAVLDAHAIKPHWNRSGAQVFFLLEEAARRARGEI